MIRNEIVNTTINRINNKTDNVDICKFVLHNYVQTTVDANKISTESGLHSPRVGIIV